MKTLTEMFASLFKRKVKGFKATNMDMTCRGFQFQFGKFHHDGPVVPCKSGFHFCEKLEDVLNYYGPDCRIFGVIGSGKIARRHDKTVCSDIEFVKEIDYSILANSKMADMRILAARRGHCLDILVNDKNVDVRREVASRGYGLDVLVNDIDAYVRREVAKQGYGLDILVKDNGWLVRREVAWRGYGLDILVNDIDVDVRGAAIHQLERLTQK